jgi:hypothetical protein
VFLLRQLDMARRELHKDRPKHVAGSLATPLDFFFALSKYVLLLLPSLLLAQMLASLMLGNVVSREKLVCLMAW